MPVKSVPALFPQIHYLGNGKRRKLLIKDIPTLWLLQAVCRHLEPAASYPLKEKRTETYWSADRRTALHDNNLTPPQRGKRAGERKKDREKTTHGDTFEDIFTHPLYTTSQHLMPLSYWRLWGLCWFLLRSGETPRANSKGREVSALLTCQEYESHSEWLTHRSAPLPHYPLKLITTWESSKQAPQPQCISSLFWGSNTTDFVPVNIRTGLCSEIRALPQKCRSVVR